MSLLHPSPLCTVDTFPTIDGVNVSPTGTITIALADTAGVKLWGISCINTDELLGAATITAGLTIDTVAKTATFTAPARGSALIFQSIVNGGKDANGAADPTMTVTFGVYVLTSSGFRVAAFDEKTEGDSSFGWITKVNALIRNGLVAAASAGAGMSYTAGAYNVGANGDGSIVVNADDIKVGVLATDAQHGARGGGTQHAAVTSSVNGFMLAADKVKLDAAATAATASVLALRGSTGELLGAWFTNAAGAAAGTATGLVRAAKNVVVVAARAAAGSADHALLATDAADGVLLGDLVTTALVAVQMKAAGVFKLLAGSTKIITATASGLAFFGDVDAGGGTGVVTLHDAISPPTTPPADGALLYAAHGGLTSTSSLGVKMKMSPAGDATGGTIREIDQRNGYATTNTGALSAVVLSMTVPQTLTDMTVDVDIVGLYSDLACHFTRKIRCRRVGSSVTAVNSMSYTGIADDDAIGGCSIAVAAVGAALEITVTGPTAKLVAWTADASRVRLFKA